MCLLHKCGPYLEGGHQRQCINDALNQLVRECEALVMFVTREFLNDEWNTLQVSVSHLSAEHKIIFVVRKFLILTSINHLGRKT